MVEEDDTSAMTKHYNIRSETERRRILRRNLPKAEAILWKKLSRKQAMGYKFRRQYGVDAFVIDFYYPELKLAVEIDGDSHFRNQAEEYDHSRQEHIEQFGITFLRFTNQEVYNNLNGILQSISDKITSLQNEK